MGRRTGAFVLDWILLAAVVTGVVFLIDPAALIPATPQAVSLGQSFVIAGVRAAVALCYFVGTEALGGQTLAKRLLKIKVQMADGSPVTLVGALKRRLPLVAGGVVPIFGPVIDFAALLAAMVTAIQDDPENRGFHDAWSGTRVVDVRTPAPRAG